MPLESLIRGFLAESDDRATRTQESYEWLLGRLPKHFTAKRVGDITPLDVREAVSKLPPSVKQHTIAVLKILFRYGIRHGMADKNPTEALTVKPSTPRSRTLSDDELLAIWNACGDDTFSRIVKLLILTGCRRSEIQHLKVDGTTATLPAEHSKNGREHTFPLPSMALPLLDRPLTFNGWSKAKARLDKTCGVKDWTLHDLRRTYVSNHARIGTNVETMEKLVNHVSGVTGGLHGIYNRHTYQPQMRQAVDSYEAFLQSLLARA